VTADFSFMKNQSVFLYCCFSYFPNSHNISIGNNQNIAKLSPKMWYKYGKQIESKLAFMT